mgnify:FL=1
MKYFKISEFDCQETGENNMDEVFLSMLDILREKCDFPFIINSGYRSVNHSIERKKKTLGTHTKGIAADIKVANGMQRRKIVNNAIALGFNGVGVHDNFVHVDMRKSFPVLWCY